MVETKFYADVLVDGQQCACVYSLVYIEEYYLHVDWSKYLLPSLDMYHLGPEKVTCSN